MWLSLLIFEERSRTNMLVVTTRTTKFSRSWSTRNPSRRLRSFIQSSSRRLRRWTFVRRPHWFRLERRRFWWRWWKLAFGMFFIIKIVRVMNRSFDRKVGRFEVLNVYISMVVIRSLVKKIVLCFTQPIITFFYFISFLCYF